MGLHNSDGRAQCSANAEATGLNPFEALISFFGLISKLR